MRQEQSTSETETAKAFPPTHKSHRHLHRKSLTTEANEAESNILRCQSATALEREAGRENEPDQVLEILGGANGYLLLIWIATASCWALAAMPMMASTFFMDIECRNNPADLKLADNQCKSKDELSTCQHLNGTLTEEFGLVPNEDDYFSIPQLSTAMFLFGIILGSIVLPRLSDHIGRHPILCFSLILSGTVGCISATVPFVQMFVALRFLQGVCFPGVGITNWVLAYESIPPCLRSYTALMFGLWWVLGYCVISPMAYLLPNWRWLIFAASAPSVLLGLLYLYILPESFHWLASNGDERRIRAFIERANYFARKFHTKQAVHVPIRRFCFANRRRSHPKLAIARTDEAVTLSRSAKINNNGMAIKSISEGEQPEMHKSMADQQASSATLLDGSSSITPMLNVEDKRQQEEHHVHMNGEEQFPLTMVAPAVSPEEKGGKKSWIEKSRHLVWVYTALFAYLWTCNTFIYYGLSLFSTKLSGDIYTNYVWVGIVEIPSYFVSPYLLDKLGRRLFIALSHFLAAFSYTMIVINELAPGWKWTKLECPLESVTLVMWLLGKFAISCSFTSLFVYASEVFPTVTRNSNIGICAACSRIGATMVPFVKQLSRKYQLGIYGATAFLGGVLTLCLPETRNKRGLPASSAEVPKKGHATPKDRTHTPQVE